MRFYTYNEFHLGDNLIFLHLLRALAKAHPEDLFFHSCQPHYISQLHEVVRDLPNIFLGDVTEEGSRIDAINTWKNAEGHWEKSPNRWDWPAHTLEHHEWTAKRMGLKSPFTCREHLLFDYPGLEPEFPVSERSILLGDSAPSSGQYQEWADHSNYPFVELIDKLTPAFLVTRSSFLGKRGYSVTEIGKFSGVSQHHIMVANGPFWPTLNTHNHHYHQGRKRIVLLDNGEQLNMPHIIQCRNVGEVVEIAKQEGWA